MLMMLSGHHASPSAPAKQHDTAAATAAAVAAATVQTSRSPDGQVKVGLSSTIKGKLLLEQFET
jgi:hypothetical protein